MAGQGLDIDYRYSLLPYRLASFLGGQSDYEDKGIAGSFKNGTALDIRKHTDSLTCQQALKDYIATGTMTNLALFTVIADDNNVYHFCRDGKIYRTTSGGSTALMYTDTHESGNIIGAAQWYDNAGNTFLFWATPTRLNVKRIIGSGYTNTEPWNDVNTVPTGSWPKTNLTSTAWHTMKICNGTLQIVNNTFLAFVGYDFSYTNQALQFIPGTIAQTLLERGIYTIAGTNRSTGLDESLLYAWDGISLDYNNKEVFKVRGINAMIDTEFALMQVGTEGLIYVSDLNSPMPILAMFGGGKCYPDAVSSYQGMALFGVFGNSSIEGVQNGVWTYGRLKKNASPVLNCDYPLDCDEIGSVLSYNGDILISYRKGTNYGVKHIDTNNKAPAIYQSLDLVTPMGTRRYPLPLDRMLFWDHVRLISAPLPSGCKVELWYRVDKVKSDINNAAADYSTGWIQANTQESATTVQETTANRMDYVFSLMEKARVMEIMIKLFPSGNDTPEIFEANTYFKVG